MDRAQAAEKVKAVFESCRPEIEFLVICGWKIELNLPTVGTSGTFGYVPSSLADNAGIKITRVIGIEDQRWQEK